MGKSNFEVRMICIEKEIIQARGQAMQQGRIRREIEPFSIRKKTFYPIGETKKVNQWWTWTLREKKD